MTREQFACIFTALMFIFFMYILFNCIFLNFRKLRIRECGGRFNPQRKLLFLPIWCQLEPYGQFYFDSLEEAKAVIDHLLSFRKHKDYYFD